jgi:hypothetical protein
MPYPTVKPYSYSNSLSHNALLRHTNFMILSRGNLRSLYRTSSPNQYPTIHIQALARNEAAIRPRQENETRRYLARLARPAHRRREFLLLLFTQLLQDEWRADQAWADSVNTDASSGVLLSQMPRESDDGTAGPGIVDQLGVSDVGIGRGTGYDGVAGFHLR